MTVYGEKLTYGEMLQAFGEESLAWTRYLVKAELDLDKEEKNDD